MSPGSRALRALAGTESEPITMLESTWSLHPQLAQDTVPVGDLPLARVLLANDANYPWLILVPRLPGLVELVDLEENAQVLLLGEISAAARALKKTTACDKLNIAALGNQVAQLHVHVIGRRRSDAAWPKPVWGVKPALAYVQSEQACLLNSLRDVLAPAGLNSGQ
jgi:diadenosine tetraphosphate (Ap4A) HIT family hydrolase